LEATTIFDTSDIGAPGYVVRGSNHGIRGRQFVKIKGVLAETGDLPVSFTLVSATGEYQEFHFTIPVPEVLSFTQPLAGSEVLPRSKVTVAIGGLNSELTKRVVVTVNGRRRCLIRRAPYTCVWKVPRKSKVDYEILATAEARTGSQQTARIHVRSQ
jgi:hypothetical protein